MSPFLVFIYSIVLLLHHDCVGWAAELEYGLSEYREYNFTSVQDINGITTYNRSILIYSNNIITQLDLSQQSLPPVNKYVLDFQAIKMVPSVDSSKLVFIPRDCHCIKSLIYHNRTTSIFSGDCEDSGFADGTASISRYHSPRDIELMGNIYYVADHENNCVRQVDINGTASTLISLHSKPFSLGGLYVAASHRVFEIMASFYTYTTYITEVDTLDLESCSPDSLSIVLANGSLLVKTVAGSSIGYSQLLSGYGLTQTFCHDDQTLFMNYSRLEPESTNKLTLKLYQLTTSMKTTSRSIPQTTANPTTQLTLRNNSITQRDSTTQRNSTLNTLISQHITRTTLSNIITHSQARVTTLPPKTTRKSTTEFDHWVPVNSAFHSTNYSEETDKEHHPEYTQEGLLIHAHQPWDHLPNSYMDSSKKPAVIAATSVGALFLLLTFLALGFVILKRKRKAHSLSELATGSGFPYQSELSTTPTTTESESTDGRQPLYDFNQDGPKCSGGSSDVRRPKTLRFFNPFIEGYHTVSSNETQLMETKIDTV